MKAKYDWHAADRLWTGLWDETSAIGRHLEQRKRDRIERDVLALESRLRLLRAALLMNGQPKGEQ